MKVLVVGSGGREHALVWKILESKRISRVYCAPGNGGTAQIAHNIPISVDQTVESVRVVWPSRGEVLVFVTEAVAPWGPHGRLTLNPTK